MRKPNLTLTLGMVLLCINITSQTLDFAGPESAGMAHIKVFNASPWASLSNISSLTDIGTPTIATAYQMRFNMDELSSRSAVAVLPSKYGIFSALVSQSGYSKSHYSRYGISLSRSFGDNVSAGLQFNYLSHYLALSGSTGALYSSLGLHIKAKEDLHIGIFIQNAEQSSISYRQTSYPLPSFFNAAVKWNAGDRFMAVFEVEKEMEHTPLYKTGIQIGFSEQIYVRSGIVAKPVEFTFGGGYSLQRLNIDVGFSHHQQLGLTSSAGISYTFKK